MLGVLKVPIQPTYRKENGIFVIGIDDVALPNDFRTKQKAVIIIPAGQIAGNHKHPRRECFISLSEGLQLVWLDENARKHEESMRNRDDLFLWLVASHVPHAVINSSINEAVILEYADDIQHDVERVEIV